MTKDTSSQGGILSVVGVGAATSLGFHLIDKITSNKKLIEQGLISKILINDIRKERVDSIINDHLDSELTVKNASLAEIAEQADVYVFTYAAPGGCQKKYHGMDKELRKKLFNANVLALYSKEMLDAFTGAKGLGIFCTNPSDNLAYFSTEIFGWEKNQANGFNHADSYRLQNQKELQIDFSNAFMIGDHGPNSFAHFTPEIYAQLMEYCNNNPDLVDKTIKQIIKTVHRKGFEIFHTMEHSNANCAPPLLKVVEGIFSGKGVFQMSHSINIDALPKNARKKLDRLEKLTGEYSEFIKTGVPVRYTKQNGVYRSEIAENFGTGCDFDIDALSTAPKEINYDEQTQFFNVIERNLKDTLTAKKYSKKGRKHAMLPVENSLLVIHTLLNSQMDLFETKKDALLNDASLMYPKKKSELIVTSPEIKTIAACDNKLITVQSDGEVILNEFPKNKLENTSDTGNCHATKLGTIDQAVRLAAVDNDRVFFATSRSVQKYSISDFQQQTSKRKEFKKDIWGIFADSNGLFCACSGGEVKELDNNLEEIKSYKLFKNDSKMIKVKNLNFNSKNYVFAMNAEGTVCMWDSETSELKAEIKSNNPCFDSQVENDGYSEYICVYHAGENGRLNYTKIQPDKNQLSEHETSISCYPDVKDLQADGNEIYLISNNRIRSFLNKETRNIDVSLNDKYINKTVQVRYKK